MRGYKIVTQTLLILSVINFALTAPIVVREHQVRGIESNDGPGPSNPLPGHPPGFPQIAASPEISSPDKSYSSKSWVPTDSDSGSASMRMPTGPPQIAVLPESLQIVSSPDKSYPSNSWVPTDSAHGTSHAPGSPQVAALPESPQIVSLPDKSYSSSSWVPTGSDLSSPSPWRPAGSNPSPWRSADSNPSSTSPWRSTDSNPSSTSPWRPADSDSSSTSPSSSQDHATPPWSSQARVRPPPNLPWAWSQPTYISRPNLQWQWASGTRTRTGVRPAQNPGDRLPTEQSHPSSSDQLPTGQSHLISPDQPATGESHLPTLLTDDGPSLIPGSTDYHPRPASPSNPGPSTKPNPPPSAEPMPPEEHEIWGSLGDILKGKFKPRFSGSGSLNAE